MRRDAVSGKDRPRTYSTTVSYPLSVDARTQLSLPPHSVKHLPPRDVAMCRMMATFLTNADISCSWFPTRIDISW
ncbi:hypothetical protein BKA23_1854 [Rudaeicoccus suwonensis]|uniref:Uncharacterized protein n=1 Tax=Rudaeicoccus suwonensis TaxID=657409 RepID=A0A561EBN7_9MICO|nr:hypothetical protein BKA23_1854 [Rudaeicoccus suwonensis]